MKLHEQVLLNIANGERCFGADIGDVDGSSLNQDDKASWDLTFQEAVEYIEENFSFYNRKYGKNEPIMASVCDDNGEPIVTYNGKKWELW